MIRKRVVRVLVYDGPVEWVEHTMEHNEVKGVFGLPECLAGGCIITETIVDSVCYDDETPLPEGE